MQDSQERQKNTALIKVITALLQVDQASDCIPEMTCGEQYDFNALSSPRQLKGLDLCELKGVAPYHRCKNQK